MALGIPLPLLDATEGCGHQHPEVPTLEWGIRVSSEFPA